MSSLEEELQEDETECLLEERYGGKDGIIFIIDSTPSMFKSIPGKKETYFQQSIHMYSEILMPKLAWNRQDCMGLILLGLEDSSDNLSSKHVKTIQELKLITLDMLKESLHIYENDWHNYKQMSSNSTYPLLESIITARNCFYKLAIKLTNKRILFFTNNDDPIIEEDTKFKIRKIVSQFNENKIQLSIIGLTDKWNHGIFYKDLEILSNKIKEEDYKPTVLADLIEQVKFPSRTLSNLPFKLGNDVEVDISIYKLTSKSYRLKKTIMSKDSNIPLQTNTFCQEKTTEDNERSQSENMQDVLLNSDIRFAQVLGERTISFTKEEKTKLHGQGERTLEMIGTKQISYDPMYCVAPPKFVTCCSSSLRKDNKLLFGALLSRCEHNSKMIICSLRITKISEPKLCSLIPNEERGGFYLYEIPFQDVVEFPETLNIYTYNDKKMPPINEDALNIAEKLIKKIKINYKPSSFPNPKLNAEMHYLQMLALNAETTSQPIDDTLPMTEMMSERIGTLLPTFFSYFPRLCNYNDKGKQKRSRNEEGTEKVHAKIKRKQK
ncbi:X-ray repair cross-complementing protein 6 isoform X2 [Prorops nasuta]|uniref:X-ray repair cross-complementing protein 6 isoform X2 n=1 Tax=Prorops nasuta TaxID=863751 RepID=UPI0034CEAD70